MRGLERVSGDVERMGLGGDKVSFLDEAEGDVNGSAATVKNVVEFRVEGLQSVVPVQ
jgi:hypothetical protein